MLVATSSHAQQPAKTLSITPKMGLSMGSLTGDPEFITTIFVAMPDLPTDGQIHDVTSSTAISARSTTNKSTKACFTGGAEAQYQFSDVLGIIFGATYRHAALSYDYVSANPNNYATIGEDRVATVTNIYDAHWSADYLGVPVMLNAYLWKGLAVKAGLQFDWMFHEDAKSKIEYQTKGDVTVRGGASVGDLRKVSLSVPVGLSYEYKNVVLDARYNIGVTNVEKADRDGGDGPSHRTSAFAVTLGYKFAL